MCTYDLKTALLVFMRTEGLATCHLSSNTTWKNTFLGLDALHWKVTPIHTHSRKEPEGQSITSNFMQALSLPHDYIFTLSPWCYSKDFYADNCTE